MQLISAAIEASIDASEAAMATINTNDGAIRVYWHPG